MTGFRFRPLRALGHTVGRMRRRLRQRPDSEHEMTLNRLAFAGLVVGWLSVATALGDASAAAMLDQTALAFLVFFAVAIGIFCHILAYPGESVARRLFAMVADFAMISAAAAAGGDSTGFFYPLYLWTVFGNGFRFGIPYLNASMIIALVGLATALHETGYWREHVGMTVGMLAGLVILPLYAGVLIRKLREAKRVAEEASQAKSLFLASVGHELRTPLNAVIGLSDLLGREALTRGQAEMVETIAQSGRSLLTLINALLDFSRLEAGRMPTVVNSFTLSEMVDRVAAMLRVEADRKGLAFDVSIAPNVPARLVADERHLEEVLVNLASNAVKFTERGRVAIAVDRLDGDDGRDRATLRVAVSDTGIGIAPEAQERVFERFTQADETIIDRFGGTGLGLAICKQLVELMGGRMGLVSEPGRGSTFFFELETGIAAPVDPAEAAARAEPDLPRLPSLSVLVAEDNRTNQMVICKMLEAAGHRPTTADDGEMALSLLREQSFDLVLMDVNMPVLNGIEATKLWRFMSLGRPRTPIVALTADATPEARARCLDAGMDACATKPIDGRRLVEVIASVLPAGMTDAPSKGPIDALEAEADPLAGMPGGRPLDPVKLDDLERLGGPEFVADLAREFIREADRLVGDLGDAVARDDVYAFRALAHALRSAAANVGAEGIFELCLSWREMDAATLARDGERNVRALEAVFTEARAALEAHVRSVGARDWVAS
ncbi:sensor histidine kinase [Chthonobacter rhizosphaerae]|uniref:sensor histidine kinase n=1 Tax=Chthonobacter rhizosphaerae TaxID=2735553 RepID=UPI0015EE77F5|nr:sensor histidine kinase [Chthonobacter rhizosphaerae]